MIGPNPRGDRSGIADAPAFAADVAQTNVRFARGYHKLGDDV